MLGIQRKDRLEQHEKMREINNSTESEIVLRYATHLKKLRNS
jgi:hypothetical protein